MGAAAGGALYLNYQRNSGGHSFDVAPQRGTARSAPTKPVRQRVRSVSEQPLRDRMSRFQSLGRATSLLEVPTEPAVTTAERLLDTRPNQRVHEHSTGLDDQPVGENCPTIRAGDSRSLVTRSPVEPAGRTLYEASLLEHLELHGAAINRHHAEQQKPTAERGSPPFPGAVRRSTTDGRVIFASGHSSSFAPVTRTTRSHTTAGGASSVEMNSTSTGIDEACLMADREATPVRTPASEGGASALLPQVPHHTPPG